MTGTDDQQPGPPERLDITWEDLENPEVDARMEQMRQARQVPLVRAVGAAPPAPTGPMAFLRGSFFALTVAGLIGGLVAFALVEVIAQPSSDSPWYGDGQHTGNIVFSLVMGLGIGLVVAAWDGIQARSLAKAGRSIGLASVALIVLGLAGGYIASLVFQEMTSGVVDDAFEHALQFDGDLAQESAFLDYINSHLHLPRGIAIGVVGLAIGAGLGLATLSWRRALNGAIGGVVGGFAGGFLFDYIAGDSDWLPRLFAIVLIGLLIGSMTGLIEVARRDHWLEIVSGGMAGKQFILYHLESVVGSAADAAITLIKDPQIAPRHALLRREGQALTVVALDPAYPVLVNGAPVTSQRLNDADLLQFGSSVVRYRAKEASAPVSPQIHGLS
jgi:hypothetical protein